uniref:40S ribosomal protein S27 n=1 Tax=Gasterosteus aculeatus aculeatus TaxID=481459 RepID=A0AAQ4QQD1_GASAC
MPLAKDLLHPSPEEEKRKHKKKRLVQSPNSYFMDVKCPGCYKITTVFSHAQTVVLCVGCSTVLCQPTGGKARLTEGQYQPPTCTSRRSPATFSCRRQLVQRNIVPSSPPFLGC